MRATRVLLACSCLAVLAGCAALTGLNEGDDVVAPPPRVDPDGGPDASADDAGVTGVGDAAAPPCDPSKPFGTAEPVTELNTSFEDIVSDVSRDGLTMYVATNKGVTGVHLFYTTRASEAAPWGPLQTLFPNGAFDDWSVAVSPDGLTAIVSTNRNGTDSDLYVATRTTTVAAFGALAPVAGLNSGANDEGPRWAADGKTLYFDSTRTGNRELFRASFNGASFGAAAPITELGSPELDAVPTPSADELTLYFLSLRQPTPSGDIWFATRANKSLPFSAPQPLAGVNGAGIDAPGHVTADGCTLYLSSTRGGNYDIYVARRPK